MNRVLSLAAAGLLLIAAIAKLAQLPTVGLLAGDSPGPWGVIALVAFEVASATALLLGLPAGRGRRLPSLFFATFAGVATYKALNGATSCGCFGRIELPPAWTASLDAVLAIGLWTWPPTGPALASLRWPTWMRLTTAAVAAIVALAFGVWRLPTVVAVPAVRSTTDIGEVAEVADVAPLPQAGDVTILEATKWVGKRFPLSDAIDIGPKLARGRWVVVFHQSECSICREAVPGYIAQANEGSHVALVQMPPHHLKQSDARPGLMNGKLATSREWFASTPVVVMLEDSIVRDAADGSAAVGKVANWTSKRLEPSK